MVDISANVLEPFERQPTHSIFYDHSPNFRNPLNGPKYDDHSVRAPPPRVYYPGHPRDNVFLAHLQCRQPSSIDRILGLPEYKDIICGLEWDFTNRWVGDYRLRKNFHRLTSLFVIKEAFEGEGIHFWTKDLECDETKWHFHGDRHMKQSLLARTVFSLRLISVGRETPFAQTPFSQLYKGIFDKDYRQWAKTHLRYREGPRRPGVLLVARSKLESTSALAECPVEIAAWPYRRPDSFFRIYDEELWKSMSAQERIDACELVLRDTVDERVHKEARNRWLLAGETPEGLFQSVKPEEAAQVLHDAGLPRLRKVARKTFAAAVANLLNLFEMCGSVYGCVVVDRKFARMYVLSSGRIAVEFSDAGDLVDLELPVQSRSGLPYSRVAEMDIHAALALRFTSDQLLPQQRERTNWHDKLGDQFLGPDVSDPEDETPREQFDRRRTVASLADVQTYVDFMAAGVVRLGAVNADVPITEKLPTPVQDAFDAEVLACLVQKGLPIELAVFIRDESRRPDDLSDYLHFTAEEQQNRPESKGLWRRIVDHWKAGHDPRWDYFPEPSGSESGETSEDGGDADSSGSDSGSEVDTDPSGDDLDEEGEDTSAEADGSGSEADDESEAGSEGSDSSHSSGALSDYSERTQHWLLETGSDVGSTQAHEQDWRTFDPGDNDDIGEEDVGYSSWSAENDFYESISSLESDRCFVLSIAERVLQGLCRIVPVTKEEMDELVQTQYKLDLERYE